MDGDIFDERAGWLTGRADLSLPTMSNIYWEKNKLDKKVVVVRVFLLISNIKKKTTDWHRDNI